MQYENNGKSIENRRFFGRNKSHKFNKYQKSLFENNFPDLQIQLSDTQPFKPQNHFQKSYRNYELEIGFGSGEHLSFRAVLYSETGFIGIEPYQNGTARLLAAIEQDDLQNIRISNQDALAVLQNCEENIFSMIHLYFPDPWPKRRHWKRRFIQQDTLNLLAKTLKSEGVLRIATDWPHYAAWVLFQVKNNKNFEWQTQKRDDWITPWRDYTPTRYEIKTKEQGRNPAYLSFVKT